jgi:hypothetical protein
MPPQAGRHGKRRGCGLLPVTFPCARDFGRGDFAMSVGCLVCIRVYRRLGDPCESFIHGSTSVRPWLLGSRRLLVPGMQGGRRLRPRPAVSIQVAGTPQDESDPGPLRLPGQGPLCPRGRRQQEARRSEARNFKPRGVSHRSFDRVADLPDQRFMGSCAAHRRVCRSRTT